MKWFSTRLRLPGRCLCAGLSMTVGATCGLAQGIEVLRKGYEEEVGKASLPLRENYHKALGSLEQSLLAKGNYAEAKLVQDERRTVEKWMGRTEGAVAAATARLDADGRVNLQTGGQGSGGLKQEEGVWTGWEASGGNLRWALPAGLKAGGYAMELVYRSAGGGILPLMLREDFHGLTRSVKVMATPDGDARVRFGVLRVRSGATLLELKLTGPGTAPGFRLVEAFLIPEWGQS